jgi:hypothetical protein
VKNKIKGMSMTSTTIDGSKFLKLKMGNQLTDMEKKKILMKEIVMSHYASDYFFYKIIK